MQKTYYIWTIGCQMNKAESERLAAYLDAAGFQPCPKAEDAGLILINSCVVRQSAENRVLNQLHSLKVLKKDHPETQIALTGCLVGADPAQLKTRFPYIDYFFAAGEFPDWLGAFDIIKTLPINPQVASYIPIMQGCNNFCSYCIVPYRRGRERSRPLEDIVNEVSILAGRGVKEVTLLGQNVNSYGLDLNDRPDLADLLYSLNTVAGLERIRFLTNHPKDMQVKLIDAVNHLEKVCEQINLPVQSGDDDILRAMNRGYTAGQYRRLIAEIRARVPGISLSTDIIIGFPGETDIQFQQTYSLLADLRFDMVHVAAYSPRAGTVAARTLMDDVPPEVKKRRLAMVEDLQAGIAGEINARLNGQIVEILVESRRKDRWCGRTRGDKLVFFSDPADRIAQLVDVKILRTSPWSLTGRLNSVLTSAATL
jgi:tRNA-2-methylthio-N6-dimethylallyladenosine synthase